MNKEDIYKMVRESDLGFLLGDNWMMHHEFEYFADLVASAERERILDICKEGLWDAEGIRYHLDIRARSNT